MTSKVETLNTNYSKTFITLSPLSSILFTHKLFNMQSKLNTSLVTVFVWIGFMSAISFMEAWLKFQAEGLTLAAGLNVGKLVFGALNKVEWAFFLIILVNLIFGKASFRNWKIALIFVPFIIVVLQSFLLLPALNARADLLQSGITPSPSNLHYYYVGIEFVKLICLFVFGLNILKKKFNDHAKKY